MHLLEVGLRLLRHSLMQSLSTSPLQQDLLGGTSECTHECLPKCLCCTSLLHPRILHTLAHTLAHAVHTRVRATGQCCAHSLTPRQPSAAFRKKERKNYTLRRGLRKGP